MSRGIEGQLLKESITDTISKAPSAEVQLPRGTEGDLITLTTPNVYEPSLKAAHI